MNGIFGLLLDGGVYFLPFSLYLVRRGYLLLCGYPVESVCLHLRFLFSFLVCFVDVLFLHGGAAGGVVPFVFLAV